MKFTLFTPNVCPSAFYSGGGVFIYCFFVALQMGMGADVRASEHIASQNAECHLQILS